MTHQNNCKFADEIADQPFLCPLTAYLSLECVGCKYSIQAHSLPR